MNAIDLGVRRGGRRCLSEVNLELKPGELLAVLGPNGAGKSTLLSALAGAMSPSEGRCELEGRNLFDWHPRELARRRAVLSQHPSLNFAFPAIEAVLLGRWPHNGGRASALDYQLAQEALAQVGGAHLAKRPVTQLSGGEAQRVHLARVLCQLWASEPRLHSGHFLLLDEPTSSLDPALALEMMALFCRARDQGASVVMIAHDIALAARFADRVLVLKEGEVQFLGSPKGPQLPAAIEATFDVKMLAFPDPQGLGQILIPLSRRSPLGGVDVSHQPPFVANSF